MPEQKQKPWVVEIGKHGNVTWAKPTIEQCLGHTWEGANGCHGGVVMAKNEEEAVSHVRHAYRRRHGF